MVQMILFSIFIPRYGKYSDYKDISDVYGLFYEKDPIDKEIKKGFGLVNDGKDVDSIINSLYLPTLEYVQGMSLNLLLIRKSGV